MQDLDTSNKYSLNYEVYKIKVDDILKIEILSESLEASLIFNQKGLNPNSTNNKESLIFDGYQVNSVGKISIPSLGSIYVEGKTIDEVREDIYKIIVESGKLIDPNIDVKLLNSYFTVLGEVQNPGRHEFLKNNMNILEAIGMAGDLTINGKRNDIKIIRDIGNSNVVYSVNLTKTEFLTSDKYQVFSGDIIIVNPNTTKIKNAGIIGNSGTLLSLLSFILSSIIIISNK
ncbi:MAG: ligand-binding protein [Candidatus Marinimicrobia bacterium]|nr:ligand-binding protein [Candidatus Neomarinimicrobiota bacterium]|tara:strand:+ start:15641 stop:16330 length:690 start_codon:yes stop_codon:yes gene_type:complete